MKRGLIADNENGRIVMIVSSFDDEIPISLPLHWEAVPDNTTDRDTWDGNRVVKYIEPPIPDNSRVNSQYAAHRAMLEKMIDYPEFDSLPEVVDYRPRRP